MHLFLQRAWVLLRRTRVDLALEALIIRVVPIEVIQNPFHHFRLLWGLPRLLRSIVNCVLLGAIYAITNKLGADRRQQSEGDCEGHKEREDQQRDLISLRVELSSR